MQNRTPGTKLVLKARHYCLRHHPAETQGLTAFLSFTGDGKMAVPDRTNSYLLMPTAQVPSGTDSLECVQKGPLRVLEGTME